MPYPLKKVHNAILDKNSGNVDQEVDNYFIGVGNALKKKVYLIYSFLCMISLDLSFINFNH